MKDTWAKRRGVILAAIGIAALLWVFESVIMTYVFDEGSFIEQVIAPGTHEIWMRLLAIGIIFGFGLYGQLVLAGRKRVEERVRTVRRFLEIANRNRRMNPLLKEFVSGVKEFTTCDSCGIRVLDDEGNIPYQAYEGFSKQFYESESPLSIRVDQCMCIDVIKGIKKTKAPYYTKGGSFFTNSTTKLLAGMTKAEKARTRNVCNQYGYESAVLIPIRAGSSILGLIHVADHKENMISVEMVETLEEVALQLGTAIQRVCAEEALKQSEEKLRRASTEYLATINMTGDIIIRLDKNGRRILVNDGACHFFGKSAKELLNGQMGDHMYPDDIAETIKVRDEIVKNKKPLSGIVNRHVTPLGIRTVEWNTYPFFDEEGQFDGWQATGRDITERKRLEDEIVKNRVKIEALDISEKMKTKLLSLVSHELRTPLASIKGFASTLLRPDVRWGAKQKKDFIEEIDREADLLARLVSDLLDMSYIDAGQLSLNIAEHNLGNLLEFARDILDNITEDRKFEVKMPEVLPPVLVDSERITQVLINLVENAVKFSGDGSPITIEARTVDGEAIIAVTDKGIGIPDELQDKIFDHFYQVNTTVAGAKKGTGLGLSICRGIIMAHGGKIWVSSKEGHGSKFNFTLPISRHEIASTK